jgi:hypothetical protein
MAEPFAGFRLSDRDRSADNLAVSSLVLGDSRPGATDTMADLAKHGVARMTDTSEFEE